MSVSQQVEYYPSSGDTKYVEVPGGTTPPGSGGDGGDGSTPPVGGGDGGDGSTPPVGGGDGGDGSTPPVGGGDGGDGSTPPVGGGDGGDGSTPPGDGGDGGDGSTPPGGGGDGGGLTIGLDPLLTVGLDGDGLSVDVLAPPDATDGSGLNLNVIGTGDGGNLIDVGLPGTGGDGSGNPIGLDSLLTLGPGGPDGDGLSLNVLAPPDATDTDGLNVNVLGNGNGDNLIDLGLPSTGGLGLPGTGDDGSGAPLGLDQLLTLGPGGPDGNGLSLNVLAQPDATDTDGLNVNVLGNGNGENLIDLGLPNTGGLGLPGSGDDGSGTPLGLDQLITIGTGGPDGNGYSLNVLAPPDATDTDGLNVNVLGNGNGENLVDVGLPATDATGAGSPLGNLGGLLNGSIGDLNGSSTGHLVDLDVGPENPEGLGLDLLSTPGADPTHGLSVSAIDVGPGGPNLLDLGVLTGASGILDVPSLGGTGTDGLTGNLLGNLDLGGLLGGTGLASGGLTGDIASGNTVSAPVNAPLDVTALTDAVSAPLTGDHGLLDLHGVHVLA